MKVKEKITEVRIGYLTKKAKTLDTLEYFEVSRKGISPKDITEMKEGKRYHEDIVKVTITVEKICG